MKTLVFVATKHNTRRNDSRTKTYWSIQQDEIPDGDLVDEFGFLKIPISLHWAESIIPKKIREILETSDKDETGYGLKQGKFSITLNKDFEEGETFEIEDIIEIKKV